MVERALWSAGSHQSLHQFERLLKTIVVWLQPNLYEHVQCPRWDVIPDPSSSSLHRRKTSTTTRSRTPRCRSWRARGPNPAPGQQLPVQTPLEGCVNHNESRAHLEDAIPFPFVLFFAYVHSVGGFLKKRLGTISQLRCHGDQSTKNAFLKTRQLNFLFILHNIHLFPPSFLPTTTGFF